MIDPTSLDKSHPYRSSPQFSLMFWNLGNWCRSRFNKCPLPEKLQKFAPHINYEVDRDREKIRDKPQFNNCFINVVKNPGAHLIMNCEAQSLYPYKYLLCGEALACKSFECIRFLVDVIAGDGNKACYLATPKAGGCPTYEVSLLQFWINCMIHTATKARIKNYGKAPDVRVKHFISCTYKDLEFLAKHLRGITTNTYTHELAKKTANFGDCCMMSVCAWRTARLESEEDINDFGDQDHMDFVGKIFEFSQ